jgi:hypothetical protein
MAGVKVTDLPSLGTAASDDIMYIVDTSTNTSKQIEVQNLINGLPDLSSGVYTPVVTDETYSEVVTVYDSFYQRIANIVNVSIRLEVALDAAEVNAQFKLSLPVSTTFTGARQVNGSITTETSIATLTDTGLNSVPTTDTIEINLTAASAGDAFIFLFVNAQYLIV